MTPRLPFPLTQEQCLLQETITQFVQQEIQPLAQDIDANNSFPLSLWTKMGQVGLHGITVPEEYGGSNMGYLAHCLAMEEISRASGSVGLSYGAHSNLCMNQIVINGTDEQKKNYLPHLVSGKYIGALAMSEANAGSDIMSLQLAAEEKSDHYLLNGSKMWVTNGPNADVVVLYARTKPAQAHTRGITAFLIDKAKHPFKTAQKQDKLGMRGSDTCELVFENCRVSKDAILGEADQGTTVLMSGLDYERVLLAAGPVGIMQACLDTVIPYCHDRKQFGQAIAEFQLMQGKIADMYSETNACRAYLYATAQACDHNAITRKDAAAIILYTAEKATQIALQAIQCLGGNGYSNEYPTGRYLRDAKLYEIGAGTSEIRRMLIGRELFQETK